MSKHNVFTNDFYIISKDFRILEFNESVAKMYPGIKKGDLCYKRTMNRDIPCASCPIIGNSNKDDIVFYDPNYKSWMESIFSKLDNERYAVATRKVDTTIIKEYNQFKHSVNVTPLGSHAKLEAEQALLLNRLIESSRQIMSSERRLKQEQMYSNTIIAQLQKLLKAAIWIIKFDADGNSVDVYRSMEYLEILGYKDKAEFPDTVEAFESHVHPNDKEKVHTKFMELITSKDLDFTYDVTVRIRDANDNYRWIHSVAMLAKSDENYPNICIGMDADVTDEYEQDKLTGGKNRVGFLRLADHFLATQNNNNYALLYFNLKKFKAFNEFSGSDNGDLLLKGYYDFLQQSDLDIVCMGRRGDHYFCIVKKDPDLFHKIEKLCYFTFKNNDRTVSIYVRCGICLIDGAIKNSVSLLDRAQLAERSVTDEYVKPYAIFDGKMRDCYVDEAFAVSEIEKALAEGQIKVYYQPIVDTQTGKIASAEALARWEHPKRGFIPPNIFIPALEKNGYISKLDYYIIKKVKDFYTENLKNNLPVVPVSVNISWMDFYDGGFIDKAVSSYSLTDLPKELLRVEITESSYAAMNTNASKSINDLRSFGVKFLLDDFGTGYSSFDMLQKYSFDILKIDQSFTHMLGVNKKTDHLVQSIIEMCHHIGIKTVAEGVETAEQLRFYRDNGCEFIQGYHFFRPMPEEDFVKLLKRMHACNMLIDYHNSIAETPISYYKAALYYTSQDMYRKTNVTTDIIAELIGQNLGVGVVSGLYDASYSLSYVSYLFLQLLGCSYSEVMEMCQGSYLQLIAPEDRDFYLKNTNMEKFYNLVLKDGTRISVKEFCYNVRTSQGERQWISSVRRLDALDEDNKKRLETMYALAEYDSFTKLLNKTPFFEKVEKYLVDNPDSPCTMLLFDIDNFKTVNDLCGHKTGDEILLAVAEIIDNSFRAGDLVGRFGGDEFVVFMKGCADAELIKTRLEATMQQIKDTLYLEPLNRHVSISIGFCCSNGNSTSTELFESADKALYKAKISGKNTYCQYLPE